MKTNKHIALMMIAIAPVALFGASATDRQIEETAKSSYNYRTVLEDHVKIKAKDGVVTLSGTVQDQDDKALAEDTVQNLPGVTRVNNEIQVKSSYPEHSDGWIALKIRSRLLVKANVSAANTKVDVKDGVVTLTGTARSAAQKELTEAYVKDIENVKSVRNEIVIKESPDATASTDNDRTVGETIDDASITSQVKYSLLSHRSTSAIKTKVDTNNGVVILTGEARSEEEKALATKLAEGVKGVKSVNNNMTVKS